MQKIEVCNLPNNNTTLALSDIYITFQSCAILFVTFCDIRQWTSDDLISEPPQTADPPKYFEKQWSPGDVFESFFDNETYLALPEGSS